MGHSITAIILKGDIDRTKVTGFDLVPVQMDFGLTLFHIDHYYSACWQYKLQTQGRLQISDNPNFFPVPNEMAVFAIVKSISLLVDIEFAIILTEYFGMVETEFANVFMNSQNNSENISSINDALRYLGVIAKSGQDEFKTIGLDKIRRQPDYLEKYVELANEYGV